MHERQRIKWFEYHVSNEHMQGALWSGRNNKYMKKGIENRIKLLAYSMTKFRIHEFRVRRVKKSICWCIMLIKIWIRLLWRHIFLRQSLWAFLAGPQLGLFMSWASEHQKRKMDPIADFMRSNLANARGRIKGNAIVINSTWSICLRQNHSRPSTPHGSQDYCLAPHTPEEYLKSGSPGKTV